MLRWTLQECTIREEIAGVDFAGVDNKKMQGWTLQEWTMTEEIATVDFAGVDNKKMQGWTSLPSLSSPVYTIQPVVRPVVKPVVQPVEPV